VPIWLKRLLQYLRGFFTELLEIWKRHQVLVDSGAEQLKEANRKKLEDEAANAKHIKEQVDNLDDADVDDELAKWLRSSRPSSGGPGSTDSAGARTGRSPNTKDNRQA